MYKIMCDRLKKIGLCADMDHKAMFSEKIAIVTGGASGIGYALCQALCKRNAVVVIGDIDGQKAEAAALALRAEGGQAEAYAVDVRDSNAIQAMIQTTLKTHGTLDYMFNNAGIGVLGEIRDLSLEHWRSLIDINLMGTVYGTKLAYDVFLKQGHGHIVNIASGYGLLSSVFNTPYAASKSAIVRLSESLRAEAADFNINVSVACPGAVKTDFLEKIPVIGADAKQAFALTDIKLITADECADHVLLGVCTNQFMITFPFYVKVLHWLYRLCPTKVFKLNLKRIRQYRKIRTLPN
ncbi:MAG: short-chain dehydrogenase [Gammaproteobacteria bacterium]|jgi:NAD(P)-dependent dehydrogenase (short-subunit alcohol dehydrogenase family)|nr:short-chain dehydrogenase [Gammaproteobacteria bacterium]